MDDLREKISAAFGDRAKLKDPVYASVPDHDGKLVAGYEIGPIMVIA